MSVRVDPSSNPRRAVSSTSERADSEASRLTLPAPAASTSRPVRVAAIEQDRCATVNLGLSLLFRELTLGLCRVTDAFFTDDRAVLITTPTSCPAPLDPDQSVLLGKVLAGVDQVNLAIDRGVSPSTIASRSRQAFDAIGLLDARPARPHPLLMLAALAAGYSDAALVGRVSFIDDTPTRRTISIPRTELAVAHLLTPTESAIVRRLFEGDSHGDIARFRNTSQRTVANQIASLFNRLKVSGRNALVVQILKRSRACFLATSPALIASPPCSRKP